MRVSTIRYFNKYIQISHTRKRETYCALLESRNFDGSLPGTGNSSQTS